MANRRSFKSRNTSAENSEILANPESSYSLLYFDVASVAATARDILAFGKTKWKNECPSDEEWDNKAIPTPFGVMPILNFISPDGKETFIAESINIDHYLAKKFQLLGQNESEELAIKGFYSNIHYLRERSLMTVTWTYKEKRKQAQERFLKNTLPEFIADHEFHLKENGSNGHYVGNKLSLADIHLVNIMDHFTHLPPGDAINTLFKNSVELSKVRENVEREPAIAIWRQSDEWKKFAQGSISTYASSE